MKITFFLFATFLTCSLHGAVLDENFSGLKDGDKPMGEWKSSDKSEGVTVEIGRPPGAPETENWVHFVDSSTTDPANIRRSIGPVTKGKLSLQINIVKATPISITLGDGAASKPEERVVQVAINDAGKVKLQSADPSISSREKLDIGQTYTLEVEFAPNEDAATSVKISMIKAGETLETIEGVTPVHRPITALRITSQGEPADGEFYVTGIKLEE